MSEALKYGICAILLCLGLFAYAQGNCDRVTLEEANAKYKAGNFAEVISLLEPCLKKGFSEQQRIEAYRIMAKTHLALDNDSSANLAAQAIVNINPKFQPDVYADPPKFIEIIEQLKELTSLLMVTSVSKKAENILEAPATVIVISQQDIEERGYSNLEEIFHDLPGFDVIRGRGPAYSLVYERGYRSISSDRTILLIDGVEENDLASDNMAISRQYPLSNIKRIEYVYGPASTMYGANAFVGVINVVTLSNEAYFSGDSKVALHANASYGSFSNKTVDATVAFRTNNVSLSITGRYFENTGMDISSFEPWDYNLQNYDYASAMNITGQNSEGEWLAQNYLNNNKTTTNALLANGLIQLDENNGETSAIRLTDKGAALAYARDSAVLYPKNGPHPSVQKNDRNWFLKAKMQAGNFTLGLQTWKTNEGLAPWYTDNSFLFREDRSRWVAWNSMLYVNYTNQISEKAIFTNLLSYRVHEIDGATNFEQFNGFANAKMGFSELAKDTMPSINTTYYYRTSNQVRNEMRFTYIPNSKFDMLSGIELRSSMVQGDYIRSGDEVPDETGNITGQTYLGTSHFRIFDLGMFSQLSYKVLSNLTLTLGGRGDYNRIRSTGGYGFVFNPRAVLIYAPKPFVFKAIYSEAFKDASYLQKYSTSESRLVNNPSLSTERVKNFEASAYWKVNKQLSLGLVGYRALYSDAVKSVTITLEDGRETEQFRAIGKQHVSGLQGELNYAWGNYKVQANYSYTLPIDDNVDLNISDIATHKANFIANAKFFDHLNVNLRANYVGTRESGANTSGSNNPITKFDSFTILNSTLAVYNYIPNLRLSLSVNNLLNKVYFVPGVRDADGSTYASRFPQFGRTFLVTLNYKI